LGVKGARFDHTEAEGQVAWVRPSRRKDDLAEGERVKDSKKPPNDPDDGMLFERTLCLFFGDEATHTAWQADHPIHRRNWLRKVCRLIRKRIETLDMTPRQKQSLLSTVGYASTELGTVSQPTWRLVFRLLALTGKLLGYGSQRRALLDLVSSWQKAEQGMMDDPLSGDSEAQGHDAEKHVISVRREMVGLLKEKGYSDVTIARVLRMSKDEVQHLCGRPE